MQKCPLCLSNNIVKKFRVNDYNVFSCKNCSVEFINPLPKSKQLEEIYSEDFFDGKLSGLRGYLDYSGMEKVLYLEAFKRIKVMERFKPGKNLLDVGSGKGQFLEIAKKHGYLVTGNDISDYSKNAFKEKNIKFIPGSLEKINLPKNKFDIVTAWDVFEHIVDIHEALMNIHNCLKSGGYLFFTTPSKDCIDAKLMSKHWYGYVKVPEHVVIFNNQSIKYLMESKGFEVVEIKQWGFIRTLGFISKVLEKYSKVFEIVTTFLNFTKLSNIAPFFPMIDVLVIARKKNP